MKRVIYSLCGLYFILTGCSNESTSDLIDAGNVDVVKYNENIKPIIQANCIGCHGNPTENGAPSLTTYNEVKALVQNGTIIDRISRSQGQSGMMPLGGTRLPQPIINLFGQWRDQGFQE